jgi:hypothetical protein
MISAVVSNTTTVHKSFPSLTLFVAMKPEKLDRLVATLNPAPFYSGVPGDEPAQTWLTTIGQRSEELRVPKPYWPSVGIHFLSGDLKNIMKERQTELTKLGCSFWEWSHFETEFKNFVGALLTIQDYVTNQ